LALLASAFIVAVAAIVFDDANNGLFKMTGPKTFTEVYIEDGWFMVAHWTPDKLLFENRADFAGLPNSWSWFSLPQPWLPNELLESLWISSGEVERHTEPSHLCWPVASPVELVCGGPPWDKPSIICKYSGYSLVWLALQLASIPMLTLIRHAIRIRLLSGQVVEHSS
ncbi:MAG: hypothetical protein AB8G99_19505, partial [Planctomycetaceae bacterium]